MSTTCDSCLVLSSVALFLTQPLLLWSILHLRQWQGILVKDIKCQKNLLNYGYGLQMMMIHFPVGCSRVGRFHVVWHILPTYQQRDISYGILYILQIAKLNLTILFNIFSAIALDGWTCYSTLELNYVQKNSYITKSSKKTMN